MSANAGPDYDPKGMPFRRLGPSGLRVPVFSLGGWLTLGETVKGDPVKDIIKTAFENGINMIDTAEGYAAGESESEIGRVIKELGYRRSDLIITTKIFFGTRRGPNDKGLSRKHIVEGLRASLDRLQMDYVDVVFAHRPDDSVPMEEIVRAFNWCIEQGWAFYWATSEWSAAQITEAYHVAEKLHLIGPIAEQCQHHMFHRERPEGEYRSIYAKYGIGTTAFSVLAGGLLTGKYNNGIPAGSRFDTHKELVKEIFGNEGLDSDETKARLASVKKLSELAEKELGCTIANLALAWVARSPNTSTVILGASKPEQVTENLKALAVIPKLTPEILDKIDAILQNKPKPFMQPMRPPLDSLGKIY